MRIRGVVKSILYALITLCLFLPSAFAKSGKDNGKLICIKNSNISIRSACKKGETELSPSNFTSLMTLPEPQCLEGEKGDDGVNGKQGPKGEVGLNGISPSGVLPSGTTVTGSFARNFILECEQSQRSPKILVTLPVKAPQPLTNENVSFSKTGHSKFACGGNINDCLAQPELSSPCKGSVTNPTAPPGYACIYFSSLDFDESFYFYSSGLDVYGFSISWITKANTATVDISGKWAYTAPLILALLFSFLTKEANAKDKNKNTAEQKVCFSDSVIRVRPACLENEKPYSLDFIGNLSSYASKCPAGSKGTDGINGSQGAAGINGKEALSPSSVVPSGEVIFGAIQDSHEACNLFFINGSVESAIMRTTASFGAILPSDPKFEIVRLDTVPGGINCRGPISSPTLTPGYVCIFVTYTSPGYYFNATSLEPGVDIQLTSNPGGVSKRSAFSLIFSRIKVDNNSSPERGLAQFNALWMYKAP